MKFFSPVAPLHSQASPAKSHQSPGLFPSPIPGIPGVWDGHFSSPTGFCRLRVPQAQGMADPHISWGSPQLWELPCFPGPIPSAPSLILPPWNGIQPTHRRAWVPIRSPSQVKVLGDTSEGWQGLCTTHWRAVWEIPEHLSIAPHPSAGS